MIVGAVNADREAIIRITVRGPAGEQKLNAVVDTGFDAAMARQ
jgi:predicted aspartyl protease